MLLPYMGLIILFPKLCIRMVVSADPQYTQYWWVAVLIAIGQMVLYLNQTSGAFLGGVEHSRLSMIGQIGYSATFLLIGLPLTAILKFPGAVIAGLLAAIVQCTTNAINVQRVVAAGTPPVSASSPPLDFDIPIPSSIGSTSTTPTAPAAVNDAAAAR